MYTLCRLGSCVVLLIAGISSAAADDMSSPSSTEYDKFLQPYKAKAQSFDSHQAPLILIVTGIVGDEPKAGPHDGKTRFGVDVSTDWQVYSFSIGPFGAKGSGYWKITGTDQKRLDTLLSNLPDDGHRLPPPDRRMVLQVPQGDHCLARVYDRANAPDDVCEILRLSLSRIRSYTLTFKSQSDLSTGDDSTDGIFALTPQGQFVTGALKLWDPVTREKVKEVPLSAGFTWAKCIAFSTDGSLAAVTDISGKGCVLETKTWKVIQDFSQPYAGRPSPPQFTADGHFLMFPCKQRDADGHYTIVPRAYDTKSWQQYDKLPGLPENAIACIQAPKQTRAVLLLKGNTMVLWNSERRIEYAKLQEHVRIKDVAFSPDETMVAVSTGRDGENDWAIDNVSVWRMDTGELVHRLRPFEAGFCEKVAGLQWTRDGNYLLAATKSDPFFTDCSIDIWNVRSGRHRGTLVDGVHYPRGVAILPDGQHVAAGGMSTIRFWDLAAALKQIREFEEALPAPKAAK